MQFFSFYVNDKPKDTDIDIAIFAGDTDILHKRKHPHNVLSKLQDNLNKI